VFYTRHEFVDHLLNHSLLPALDDHLAEVRKSADRNPSEAAQRLFDFSVVDPAMGSAHFLTAALDMMADRIEIFLAEVGGLPGIAQQLSELSHDDGAVSQQPEDGDLLRRLILKRCIYGVDLSPLAVEVANVTLWLASFVPGLALSYLGSNLKCGDALIGVADQCGALPITAASFESAIDLNGVAAERNREAFRWGRQWVIDPAGVELAAANAAAAGAAPPPDDAGSAPPDSGDFLAPGVRRILDPLAARTGFGDLLEMLSVDLSAYQSAGYAEDFLRFIAEVADAEEDLDGWDLTATVARSLHKLTAYKDEYEVARLLLEPDAVANAEAIAGPGARLLWHLHPPFLRALGVSRKLKLGRWARPLLVALRGAKRLRGTPLDLFGYAKVRRCERRLPGEYREAIRALLGTLDAINRDEAVGIADLVDQIRGYEDLKMSRVATYRQELSERVERFCAAVPAGSSA